MRIGNIEDMLKWGPEEEKRVLWREGFKKGFEESRETFVKNFVEGFSGGFVKNFTESFTKDFSMNHDEVHEKILVSSVKAMLETLGCPRETAMELLKIPADLQPKILAML